MKTRNIIKILLGIALIALVFTMNGMAKNPDKACADKIWQKLTETVKYPEFAAKRGIEGEVTIIFAIVEPGVLQIKDVITTNEELAEFVKNTVSSIKCQEMLKSAGNDFKVKFRFKLI